MKVYYKKLNYQSKNMQIIKSKYKNYQKFVEIGSINLNSSSKNKKMKQKN